MLFCVIAYSRFVYILFVYCCVGAEICSSILRISVFCVCGVRRKWFVLAHCAHDAYFVSAVQWA